MVILISGIIAGSVILLISIIIGIKLCYQRRYHGYHVTSANQSKDETGIDQSEARKFGNSIENMDENISRSFLNSHDDYIRVFNPDNQSRDCSGSRDYFKIEKDSGRGDSDSNPDTLTDSCVPECLTLGHSDSCWLPATTLDRYFRL